MSQNNFDDQIRKKLIDLSPQQAGDAWDIFEKKRETLTAIEKDHAFDQNIKTTLKNDLKPRYNHTHWEILKNNLIVIDQRKRAIHIAKTAEAAILILLLIVINNVMIVESKQKEYHEKSNSFARVIESPDQRKHKLTAENRSENTLGKAVNQRLLSTKTNRFQKNNASRLLPKGTIELQKLGLEKVKVLPTTVKPIAIDVKVTNNKGIETYAARTDENFSINRVEIIPTCALSPLKAQKAFTPMTLAKALSSRQSSISIFASSDVNLINTPFDRVYALESYNKEALNNSYGISYAQKLKNTEIETGLTYAQRIYQPEIFTETYGQNGDFYFEKNLNKIRYDLVSIPLNLKYHFASNPNWSAYFMTGISLNIVMAASYDINQALILGEPPVGRLKESKLDDKNFIAGFLQGDNFNENYFVSATVGFGLEKKIINNTSLYLQPSYQRQLWSDDIGIGPNKDKIHTASLQVGIKYHL
jgi:hypothetical protein